MKVITENSIYEFNIEEKTVRRIPARGVFASPAPLSKDNEWVKYLSAHYEVGEQMNLVTEHLDGEEGKVTLRRTSVVLKIEE